MVFWCHSPQVGRKAKTGGRCKWGITRGILVEIGSHFHFYWSPNIREIQACVSCRGANFVWLCVHAFSSGGTVHKTYIIDYKSKWFKILILTTPHYQTTNCGVTLILWLQFMTVIEILSCLGAEWGDISPNGKSLRTDVSEPRLFLITSLSFCQSADYLNESEPNTWITCAATTE